MGVTTNRHPNHKIWRKTTKTQSWRRDVDLERKKERPLRKRGAGGAEKESIAPPNKEVTLWRLGLDLRKKKS